MKLFPLILILIVTVTASFAQKSLAKQEESKCPVEDKWAIESTPTSNFFGFKDAPAKIITITLPRFKDGKINEIELKNYSGKTITAVKIKWFLFRVERIDGMWVPQENPTIIMKHESVSIDTGEFKPEERMYIYFSIGRPCGEIYDELVKYDVPERELWIEFAISEISYADGSK